MLSSIILCILGTILGCIFLPYLFYDQWIWKYYWGPIVADAAGHPVAHNGIYAYEGYTLISEITYGIILITALFFIYRLLKTLKITIDWRFCLALMPYILFGPVTRVLEDTTFFTIPVVYWFISPLIYLQIAVYAIGFLIIGWYLERIAEKKTLKRAFSWYLLLVLFFNSFYYLLWLLNINYGARTIHPLVFTVLSVLSFTPLCYSLYQKQRLTTNKIIFSGGFLLLAPSLYLIAWWIAGYQWNYTSGVRFDIFMLISGLVVSILAVAYLFSRFSNLKDKLEPYRKPLNLAMIAGHMIDGLTSYVSIYDPLKMGVPLYLEKHPASNFLMETWPPLFPIVKFLLIIVVIYLFDIFYKKDLRHYQALVNLLKIGILILGFSPGVRDLLRVTMGV
jgi:uncharacterized membrane protein